MAAAIQKRLAIANLRLPGTDAGSDPPTTLEEITQELAAFLIETPALQLMLVRNPDAATTTVIRYFLNHARDLIRSSAHSQDVYKDNWRAFRRHVLAVLGDADEFVKFPAPRDMAFGLSDTARPVLIPPEKTAQIPFPSDVPAHFERMNQKKHLLKLAVHFWGHCADIAGTHHVRMNLNDFISWIAMYVPLQVTPDIPDETDDSFSRMSAPGPDPEKKSCLEAWANNFFNRLDSQQKKIFYLYECLGYTGKQVAELMGRKSHLTYQRDLIRENLKQFLCPLEWVSPSPEKGHAPVDPDAFRFFMDTLCDTLGQNLEKTF
ncbi:MAG: hypothetical protein RQ739_10485 [Desulfotignum sp.]|nr:hypothetical protein [Desulfotignum sp.]